MVDTIKFSQMTNGGDIANNDQVPGLLGGENVLFNNPWVFLAPGTTAQRPAPSSAINYRLRLNTDTQLYEYYNAVLGDWVQIQESAFTQGPFVIYTADANIPDGQNLGALSNGILKQTITTGVATLNIAVNGTDYYGPGFVIPGASGGTGVNNGSLTINLGSATSGYVLTSDSSGNATWHAITDVGAITTIDGNTGSITASAGVVTFTSSTGLTFTGSSSTMTLGGILTLASGGTNANLTASAGAVVYSTASAFALTAVGSSGQLFISTGTTAPAWTTTTYPTTNAINTMLYASSANVMSAIAAANNGVLITSNSGVPSWLANSGTPGFVLTANAGAPPSWQNIQADGAVTALNGDSGSATPSTGVITISGGSTGLTFTGASHTLTLGGTLALGNGGTGAALTASNGGIFYSTASAAAILSGTATAGLALLSGASGAPSWSTSPPITKINVQRVTTTGAGTYTPTPGMVNVIVRAQAGAGQGGSAATTSAGSDAAGGGGGGGEYIEALFTAAQIGASKSFVVGTGGSGAAAGNVAGNNGANTTFNTSWIIATGGTGGAGSPSNVGATVLASGGIGGTGGSVATGTLLRQLPGAAGGWSFACNAGGGLSGNGGNAGSGGGGALGVLSASSAGTAAAANSGAGGSGASSNNGTQQSGGQGGSGFFEFIEFISV